MAMFRSKLARIDALRKIYPAVDQDFLQWLDDNGYFTAQASTKYHGAYEGGLFDHSLSVAEILIMLTKQNNLIWDRPESPVIIGLFHDICKMDQYKLSPINDSETTYKFNAETLYKGHGDKSVMILAGRMKLTEEEIACIRYHMGAFTEKEEWDYYTRACKRYVNVLWTHHADMLASQVMQL